MTRTIASLFLLLSALVSSAKDINLEIAFSQFLDANDNPYLEIYFSLNGNSVDYTEAGDGKFVGGIEVTLSLQDDSLIVGADRFRLLSPPMSDTAAVTDAFIHQSRISVPQGTYTLNLDISDVNDEDENYRLQQEVEVNFDLDDISSSEIIFLEGYKQSETNGIFSKSGYDLIPLVSSGTPYYPEVLNELSFYTEFYQTEKMLGEDEPFVLKYYIRDLVKQKDLNEYAAFARRKAGAVTPLLASFNIADLRSGNYELAIELLNKEGEIVYTQKKFFYRKNNLPQMNLATLGDSVMMESFVNNLGGLDSIFLFIKYLYPISTDSERKIQKELLAERKLEKMKKYFYGFWVRVDQENPQRAWQIYHSKVKVANDNYETRIRPGYMSDRGRVFLVYGQPSRVDNRRMEPQLPPYEIWQYDNINTPYAVKQNNRIFIFAEFQPSTNDYQLFHSTAIGELSSRRWKYDMALRYAGMNGNIDDEMPAPEFGSRTNNNIILNSTGSDRDTR